MLLNFSMGALKFLVVDASEAFCRFIKYRSNLRTELRSCSWSVSLELLGVPSASSLSLKRGIVSCFGDVEGKLSFFLYTGKDSINMIDFRLAAPFLCASVSDIIGRAISPFLLVISDH